MSAGVAFLLSLIVFAPILDDLDVGWSGGDMLSTYVNTQAWNGFWYATTTQFGFPLGMDLNYFPGIDITENAFAAAVNAVTGSTFLGVNLLVVLSFPLVAALAYLVIRMAGLQGPLAIALAVAFAFIPFHWGRALGHTYLSTLYSAVVGAALVLLVGSGLFGHLLRTGSRGRRTVLVVAVVAMVATVAWTGVYYAAFTIILGVAALLWRFAHRADWRALAMDSVPFAGIAVLAAVGFLPSLLTLRADPPLASLGERTTSESVTYAGNLAMAILPIPQSSLPRMGYYNEAVLTAFADAPFGESNVITNFGTWVTLAALVTLAVGLVLRTRRRTVAEPAGAATPVITLGLIGYLLAVGVLFFVPWGLNLIFADLVTAQIRAWNRLLPFLLLLVLLGAAVVLRRTALAERMALAVPIALVLLGLTAIDSVYPFRAAYAGSVAEGREVTDAARAYAADVNRAIPQDCGVLQLPYMGYPEFGVVRGINDYDHFWTAITNPGKDWSYGSVKYTDASIWAGQLPDLPTDGQLALARAAGFCAVHLDLRGFVSEERGPVTANLSARLGAPVADGFDGMWQLYSLAGLAQPEPAAADVAAFLGQPFIERDDATALPRDSELERYWWWATAPSMQLTLTPSSPDHPVRTVTGRIAAPPCGPLPVEVTLEAGGQVQSATLIAEPGDGVPFAFEVVAPTDGAAVLTVNAPGRGCDIDGIRPPVFAQVVDVAAR
ncbi:MAG: hypothetical protein ACYC0W_04345 [Candidatus Nanopelagicales bacterium]